MIKTCIISKITKINEIINIIFKVKLYLNKSGSFSIKKQLKKNLKNKCLNFYDKILIK